MKLDSLIEVRDVVELLCSLLTSLAAKPSAPFAAGEKEIRGEEGRGRRNRDEG